MSTVAISLRRCPVPLRRASVDTRSKFGDVGWVLHQEALVDLLGQGRTLVNVMIEPEPTLVSLQETIYVELLSWSKSLAGAA